MVELILSEAAGAAHGGAALWSSPSWWVALAMTIFLAVLVWKKAPAALGAMLDKRIAEIKQQLSEAEQRSEEHTSELQSLMRISYAVFCLKKKTNKQP